VLAVGPFLNFRLAGAQLARQVLAEVDERGARYGADDLGDGKCVVVEYSSPNIAKRMHVGHIRSTIIGQAINNILRYLGYQTIADNHLGDYGKQFGTNLAAIERFGRPSGEGESALQQIEAIYSRYNRLVGGGEDDGGEDDGGALDDVARACVYCK
jgi:arginyl-tRNA synthetase